MNVALRFAYDGSVFPNGYARQPEGGTVEDAIIAAAQDEGYVDGSWTPGSRTDKGVSAAENVARLQLNRAHLKGLVAAVQANLPEGVWVTGAAEVDAEWNPRFHAIRTYNYIAPKQGEDLDAMQRGAERFEGGHDMSAFAKLEEHRNPQRIIDTCRVVDDGDTWRFTVSSEGFLWNQVRRMVNALLCIGRGDASPTDIDAALASSRPHDKFGLAPADGLLLQSVNYNPPIKWDQDAGTLDGRRLTGRWQRNRVNAALLAALNE